MDFGRDIFLIKIDTSGNLLWAKTYGTSSNETSRSIYPTSDGNFVIVGWSGYWGNNNVLILKVDPVEIGVDPFRKLRMGAFWLFARGGMGQ
jgi:hypothetical protein